jgi:hypothetical protein
VIVTRGRGYVLVVEAGRVDVAQFEALVAEGRRALGEGRRWPGSPHLP